MRKQYAIFLLMLLSLPMVAEERLVGCGEWVTFSAGSRPGFHFERWSDGSIDSVRTVQVTESAAYIAFFSDACVEYANWPVIALYDWLIMLHVKAIEEQGFYLSEADVSWYRAVGDPDDMHLAFPQDDEFVCSGYYLTIDQSLRGTGLYYAVANVVDPQGRYCEQLARSQVIDYHAPAAAHVRLAPNNVRIGETMVLSGLNPEVESRICVYSSTGQLVDQFSSVGEDQIELEAHPAAGCYLVRVDDPEGRQVVRYIVNVR